MKENPPRQIYKQLTKGWKNVANILWKVILDELTIALYYSMLSLEEVLNVLRQRSPHTEVVITGRYAPQELIDIADLVTNMQEVKHYYSLGVLSRNGIDH